MSIIPADAAEKPVRDFYADLSKEEREAEGLPPAAEPAAPASPAAPVAAPAKAAEPAKPAEPAAPAEPDTAEQLLEEIAGFREDLEAALGAPPAAVAEGEDPLLKQALEHDDPVIRGLAQRTADAEKQLNEIRTSVHQERTSREEVAVNSEFDALQKGYTIGGQPISAQHVTAIEEFMLAHPAVTRSLGVEDIARVMFKDALARAATDSRPPQPAPAGGPAANGPVATIVDTGTAGGAAAEPFKPRPNETIESAVQAAGRRFGWKR